MIKPENIAILEPVEYVRDINFVDIAKLHGGLNELNRKILELEAGSMFRQVELAKDVMNASRDCMALMIFALHRVVNEMERRKPK